MIEYYINELLKENITYIPPWTESTADTEGANEEASLAKGVKAISCQDGNALVRSGSTSSRESHKSEGQTHIESVITVTEGK